jgi:membrane protein YdbS with pleckstrin-like domain
MSDNEALHRAAEKRLKDQSAFWRLLGVFVIVWVVLIAVWAVVGGGYFWPFWAIFGMGIALAFVAWGAFGPREKRPSEERIQREMRKYD